jgi:hypothetical protein
MIQSIDAETLIKRVPDYFPPMQRPGGQILFYGVGYSPDLRESFIHEEPKQTAEFQ